MGAQMAVDLLETYGFRVTFGGGGIANDEILAKVNQHKPDVLLMFASSPGDLPNIRAPGRHPHPEIGASPSTQIAVGGGVFIALMASPKKSVPTLWATGPLEIVDVLIQSPAQRAAANQRTVGKNRNKTKRAAA